MVVWFASRLTPVLHPPLVPVLTNCQIITEGFDVPACSAIVCARPTASRGLFLQMIGRGLRRAEEKADCLVLDFAGLIAIHGLPTDTPKFSLEGGLAPESDYGGDGDGTPKMNKEFSEKLERMDKLRSVLVKLGHDENTNGAENSPWSMTLTLRDEQGDVCIDAELEVSRNLSFKTPAMDILVGTPSDPSEWKLDSNPRTTTSDGAQWLAPFLFAFYDRRAIKLTAAWEHEREKARWLEYLVEFLANPTEASVRSHFANLLRYQNRNDVTWSERSVHNILRNRWGADFLEEVTYDYATWSQDEERFPTTKRPPVRVTSMHARKIKGM